jgi:ligand-binding SRPBCC domain-containing protein
VVTLKEVTLIDAPLEKCFDMARSIEVHLAGNVHSGEAAIAVSADGENAIVTGLLCMGQRVTWRAKHFGVWHTLTSEITAFDPPAYFQDTMVRGIFRFMKHDHRFVLRNGATEMTDHFFFAAPLPVLGPLAETLFLRRYMTRLLHERNVVVKEFAQRQ